MRFFDLHCDTLYRAFVENQSLYKNNFQVDIKRQKKYDSCVGCFAVWIPDNVRGDDAIKLVEGAIKKLYDEKKRCKNRFEICKDCKSIKKNYHKPQIILTVESGAALAGNASQVKTLSRTGVKIITLTWNGECELGCGVGSKKNSGLTKFGKLAVRKMEKHDIIIDISHASPKLFFDVCEVATKPFIASHSCAKSICEHPRNLSDEQFDIICARGGLVGITFCKDFLNSHNHATIDDILKHTHHFLERGGKDVLALGSDFDGADMPNGVTGIESAEKIYEYFLIKNYSQILVDKIFFDNAYNFMKKNCG